MRRKRTQAALASERASERVGRAGDCASATNNSFLVALRLRFMNERRTGTLGSPRFAPPPLSPSPPPHAPLAFISLSPTDPRPSRPYATVVSLSFLPCTSLSLSLSLPSYSYLSSYLSLSFYFISVPLRSSAGSVHR